MFLYRVVSQPMTEENNSSDLLVCKPTKWFIWRALAMLAMFSVFTVLFVKDGRTGYRQKNYQYYMYESFKDAGDSFEKLKAEGGLTEVKWKEFASSQSMSVPEESLENLPQDEDLSLQLPDALVNGYAVLDSQEGQQGVVSLWRDFSGSKNWDEDAGDKAYDKGNIKNQFVAAGVAGFLALIALFILIRTMLRSIKADGKALYSQTGEAILYSDMTRIDKRKWENKGMALVYYQKDGGEKKVKIDGMVYGQFKEEDGAPAERLFARVLENFKGEVLDYEGVEESSGADA